MVKKINFIPLIIGGVCLGILGFLSSQYLPIWGGFAALGMPFSPARLSLAPSHIILFSLVGVAVGYAYSKYYKK